MADSKFKEANEKIADGYKKIEDSVVGAYKKIEDSVTGAFKKVEDEFVGRFLTHEDETAEEAEQRLRYEQTARQVAEADDADQIAKNHPGSDIGEESLEKSLETAKKSIDESRNASKH